MSSPELLLSLQLIAALCLEAHIDHFVYYKDEPKNWTDARLYCQREHVDLVTMEIIEEDKLTDWLHLGLFDSKHAWIGLHREQHAPWRWIDLKTGEGTVGDDLTQSISWYLRQRRLCTIIDKDLMWHSVKCSDTYGFYCSVKNKVTYQIDKLTWSKASSFCKENNGELATITPDNTHELTEIGWIGLYRDSDETWSWAGNDSHTYNNWAPGEPLTDDCGSLLISTGTWLSNMCSEKLPFICYDDNLVVVKKNKTWEAALEYCRTMGRQCNNSTGSCRTNYDLLNLTDLSDYNYIRDRIYRATTDEVWLGLRFLGGEWWWLNGEKAGKQKTLLDCPSKGQHCGTMSKHDTDNWIIRDCTETRNFICYTEFEQL